MNRLAPIIMLLQRLGIIDIILVLIYSLYLKNKIGIAEWRDIRGRHRTEVRYDEHARRGSS
jgi:hypothetical protein